MHMEIKMKKNAMGSECGKFTKEFLAGESYDVTERLADVFVNEMKVAEYVCGEKAKESHDNKSMDSSDYQNKAEKSEDEKKPNKGEKKPKDKTKGDNE
jgi:hypothetical protein